MNNTILFNYLKIKELKRLLTSITGLKVSEFRRIEK